MRVGEFSSIAEFVRKAPVNQQYADTLRDAGTGVMDKAIKVFFQPDREVGEANEAIHDLIDLQSGIRGCIDRNRTETSAAADNINSTMVKWKTDGTLKPASEEKLTDAPSLPDYNGSHTIHEGRRVYSAESANVYENDWKKDNMAGLCKLFADFGSVLPLYTAVALVPGPMSATVKDYAKDVFSRQADSSSSTSGRSSSTQAGASLLMLGGYYKSGSSSVQGGSSLHINENYTRTTTDERVMPALLDIRKRLERLDLTEGTQITPNAYREVQDFETQTETTGWWHKTTTKHEERGRDTNETRKLSALNYEPAHISVPMSGMEH